jgi:hypothetical protein
MSGKGILIKRCRVTTLLFSVDTSLNIGRLRVKEVIVFYSSGSTPHPPYLELGLLLEGEGYCRWAICSKAATVEF